MTTTVDTSNSSNSALTTYLQQQAANVAAQQTATANGSSSTGLATATSSSTIGSNFNTFINILTAQLKNQDPTSATDPNQFTEELVQFAGVEQQLNTNNDLQTLINLQKTSSGATADLNYIGQYVESPTTTGQMALQSGSAEIGYTLPTAATNVAVTVTDGSGNTVANLSGATNAGLNYLTWNGQSLTGAQLPDGAYTFSIVATGTNGATETITDTRVLGKVTGVTTNSDGTTDLALGTGTSVATSGIDAIYTSSTLPAATVSNTSTTS